MHKTRLSATTRLGQRREARGAAGPVSSATSVALHLAAVALLPEAALLRAARGARGAAGLRAVKRLANDLGEAAQRGVDVRGLAAFLLTGEDEFPVGGQPRGKTGEEPRAL